VYPINHSITHSHSLFDAPGTEAFASDLLITTFITAVRIGKVTKNQEITVFLPLNRAVKNK